MTKKYARNVTFVTCAIVVALVGAVPAVAENEVTWGGELGAAFVVYPKDMDETSTKRPDKVFSGKLTVAVTGDDAEGAVKFKVAQDEYNDAASPVTLDEAYLRSFFGPLMLEGGLRKLTWGKADSLGPLDVVNPLDYTDLTNLGDATERKIARPLVHAAWNLGGSSRLEGVFLPAFASHRLPGYGSIPGDDPQTGVRFTTTVGPVDLGLQYFHGNLLRPRSDPYHQVGMDYAQVIAGNNLRGEFAANFIDGATGDRTVLAWSAGFDRDLFAGIKVNLQGSGTVGVAGDTTSTIDDDTKITAELSRGFFNDEVTLRARALFDVDDSDYLIMPSGEWTRGDVTIEVAGGIFAGNDTGELGQFHEKSFVKASMTYAF